MLSAKAVRMLGLGAILIGAIVAGMLIGTVAGGWKAESHQHSRSESLDEYLERNLRGIDVGRPFPDIDLWHADGVTAARLSDLLPDGGVLFYVSSACETCVDAIAALTDARAQLGAAARAVVIVTDADPRAMLKRLAERGVDAAIYWDMQRLLDVEHNVRTTRTYFLMDCNLIVTAMGTTEFNTSEYLELIRNQ